MVEILGSMLAGALPAMVDAQSGYKHYFAAYNIAAFVDPNWFKSTMDRMMHTLKTTKPAKGLERVLYPGLSEYEEERERRAHDIPLHKESDRTVCGYHERVGCSTPRDEVADVAVGSVALKPMLLISSQG